jgi:hypothetical protein
MPTGVTPATALNPVSRSNSAGSATARPIVTTSLATADAVRRCRKISHSRTRPSRGARITTDTSSAGTIPHPRSVCNRK